MVLEKQSKEWLHKQMLDWAFTFQDIYIDKDEYPEEYKENNASYKFVNSLAKKIKKGKLTVRDYEEIVFHLYQKNYNADD